MDDLYQGCSIYENHQEVDNLKIFETLLNMNIPHRKRVKVNQALMMFRILIIITVSAIFRLTREWCWKPDHPAKTTAKP